MAEQDEDFAALFEAEQRSKSGGAVRSVKVGQQVAGTVVAIGEAGVFVDIGTRTEARLDVADTPRDALPQVGDTIRATVVSARSRGPVVLKVALGGSGTSVAELETAAKTGLPVEGTFTQAVKAGLEVDLAGQRAFCPASQVDLAYVGDLQQFVGQRHFFRVLEVRDRGRSIVVSRKALLEQQRQAETEALLARLEVGTELEGIVQTIQSYGVFVDLGGIQGLVHVSELSHARVSNPTDVVSVGDRVRVKVLAIERGKTSKDTRISLSMKALEQPSEGTEDLGDVLDGTVSKVEGSGVWVDTPAGSGFVPTGQLPLPKGGDPRRAYSPGQTLEVTVLRRDNSGKLRFSAKNVAAVEERRNFAAFRQQQKTDGKLGSLGDLLKDKIDPGKRSKH